MPYTIDGNAGAVPQEVLEYYKSRAGSWAGGGQNAFTDAQGFSWIPIGEDSGIWRGSDAFGNQLPISGFRRAAKGGQEASKIGESDHYFKPDGSYSHTSFNEKVESGAMQLAQLAAAVGGIGFLGAAAGVPLGMGGAAGAGAVGSGAGFVGEGALSGVAGWDAALAGAPSWSAASGMTAGAGGIGAAAGDAGLMYAGADAAAAGSLGSAPATLGGSVAAGAGASTVPSFGNLLKSGASSLFGGGGSSAGGFDWTSLIGPAISAAGGVAGADAAKDAANAQLQSTREAREMLKPWIDAGGWAIGQGANMLGKSGPEVAKNAFLRDPGYAFRQEEGEKGMQRAAAAAGGMGSGKFLKDAMRFNQGLASQEFGNSFNRLMSVAGMGQSSTNTGADLTTQGGNAIAAGKVGSMNALTNGLGQGWSMYSNQQQQNQNNALMNRILGGI